VGRAALVLLVVPIVAACGRNPSDVQANVSCKGAEANVHCDVVETHGMAPIQACWDLAYVCTNGTKLSGSYCQAVADGKTVPYEIPVVSIKGSDKCDTIETMTVEHFKLKVN